MHVSLALHFYIMLLDSFSKHVDIMFFLLPITSATADFTAAILQMRKLRPKEDIIYARAT